MSNRFSTLYCEKNITSQLEEEYEITYDITFTFRLTNIVMSFMLKITLKENIVGFQIRSIRTLKDGTSRKLTGGRDERFGETQDVIRLRPQITRSKIIRECEDRNRQFKMHTVLSQYN